MPAARAPTRRRRSGQVPGGDLSPVDRVLMAVREAIISGRSAPGSRLILGTIAWRKP